MTSDSTQNQPAASAVADDPVAFAKAAARIAYDTRAEDVVILDLRGVSTIADVFVIATGSSDRQMDAVLDAVEAYAKTIGRRPYRSAGRREGRWVLADYVDVVVHMFDADHRSFYDLESLWGDAPQIDWDRPTPASDDAASRE